MSCEESKNIVFIFRYSPWWYFAKIMGFFVAIVGKVEWVCIIWEIYARLAKKEWQTLCNSFLILPLIVPKATFWITWLEVKKSNIILICVSLNFHTKRLMSSIFDNIPCLLSSFLAELNLSTVNGGTNRSLNLSKCGFLNLSTRITKGWNKIY